MKHILKGEKNIIYTSCQANYLLSQEVKLSEFNQIKKNSNKKQSDSYVIMFQINLIYSTLDI